MLQFRGPGAFDDPEIIDALQLTKDQRQRIRELEFANMRSLFGFARPGRGPGPGPKTELAPRQQYRRNGVEPILQVLTPAQKETWKKLTGAPVEFKAPERPTPPRG